MGEVFKFGLMAADIGEDFKFGLMVAGIGMLAIFALLGLLILFIYGLSYLLHFKNKEKTYKAGKIDAKILAAITACISCFYLAESISETKTIQPDFPDFIVKSIKRK